MDKKNVLVVFGGRSTEHEVSCHSAVNIIKNIDTDAYNVYMVGITKAGAWLYVTNVRDIEDNSWLKSGRKALLSPDAKEKSLYIIENNKIIDTIHIDVCFPILHGKLGEDGTIQGLLELSSIPYVGCGVLSSAVSMDKFFTKIIVENAGIRQAAYVGLREYELRDTDSLIAKVEGKLSYPMFIKPSRAGSSTGISKVNNRSELMAGLKKAFSVDSKVLIEEFIRGREVECAVLGGGNKKVLATGIGEILAAGEFYDYDAKYNNPDSKTVIDPDVPAVIVEAIRKYACTIFNALDGYGLARVDFFVTDNNEIVFNEINTMPGFTAISMYPMLWEHKGLSKKQLVSKLLENALEREMLLRD